MAGKKRTDFNGRVLRENELQRKDGRYIYRYIDALGVKRSVSATTLKELRVKEKTIDKDKQDGIVSGKASEITLNQLFEKYIHLKYSLRDSTRDNYIRMWKNNVQEKFGEKKVSDIKKSDIRELYANYNKKGLAKNTIKFIHNLLSPCLNMAVEDDIIRKNPAAGIEIEGTEKKKEALTIRQQRIFLNFIKESPVYNVYFPMITLAICTGLRVGELTGLSWGNIDLKKNNEIIINHQLRYLKIDGATKFCITDLKTDAGRRNIPISNDMRQALKQQREMNFFLGRSSQVTIDGVSDFIFVTKNGLPFATNAVNSILKNVVCAYNRQEEQTAIKENRDPVLLPHISAHILRHTGCTRMAESGIDPKTLQYVMGHSNINVTMDIYNHVDIARVTREIQKTNGIIQYG